MTNKKRTIIFIIVFLTVCVGLGIAVSKKMQPKYKFKAPTTKIATVFIPSKPIKSFSLMATNGTTFTEKSFRGHWTLLFFGYPGCPDVCPKTLGIIRDAWNKFEAQRKPIPARFVFADISNDPVSISQLKQFLHTFHANFIGLTGSPSQVRALSDQLGIYAKPEGDFIDHTPALMVIDTQGRLVAVMSPPFTADEVVQDLQILTRSK